MRECFRSASTRARSTASASTFPTRGRDRRRSALQSAVTILYPRVFVELRRISREITDGQRSRCPAILRTDHPAFKPVEISARSVAVSILRTTRHPPPDQHRCYDAMTPPSAQSLKAVDARVVMYEELLANARQSYQAYLDTADDVGRIQAVLDAIAAT